MRFVITLCMHIYIIYIYTNLPVDVIVRLPHLYIALFTLSYFFIEVLSPTLVMLEFFYLFPRKLR